MQRERETESEAGSRLWAVSTEPNVELKLTNCEIMTGTKVLNRLSHPGAPPKMLIFERESKGQRERERESQAGSMLSVQNLTQGSNSATMKSWSAPKPRVGYLTNWANQVPLSSPFLKFRLQKTYPHAYQGLFNWIGSEITGSWMDQNILKCFDHWELLGVQMFSWLQHKEVTPTSGWFWGSESLIRAQMTKRLWELADGTWYTGPSRWATAGEGRWAAPEQIVLHTNYCISDQVSLRLTGRKTFVKLSLQEILQRRKKSSEHNLSLS